MKNYLNPNWLLSRLLERFGIMDYTARVEFAAHFFAGATFALLGLIPAFLWVAWTIFDELVNDGWKNADTIVDLISKLSCPVTLFIWRALV